MLAEFTQPGHAYAYLASISIAARFRENFKDVSWVKVPKVFWEYTSAEVLVLEYVPGVKINDGQGIDRMGLDRQQLARKSVESYLMQL